MVPSIFKHIPLRSQQSDHEYRYKRRYAKAKEEPITRLESEKTIGWEHSWVKYDNLDVANVTEIYELSSLDKSCQTEMVSTSVEVLTECEQ
jgi:hypothetical protein